MSRWLTVLLLSLAAACSSPLRETSEPAQPSEPEAAAEQPAAAPSPPPAVANSPAEAPTETAVQPAAAPAPAPKADIPAAPRPLVTPDPVKVLLAEESQRVERDAMIARLAAERDAATAVVARRQKDLLAFKNPFLPRPQLTPEEAEEIRGLGGAARAQWAERRVADARAALEAAQKAYDDATAIR